MAQVFIGEMMLVGFNFAPVGFNFCNGAIQSIGNNGTLFSLIGTTFGGDGVQTFALPDLRSRVTVHNGTGPGLNTYILGELGGAENVAIIAQTMPQHNHVLSASSALATLNSPSGAVFANTGQNKAYSDQSPANAMVGNMLNLMGSNLPHSNIQPFLACNWIIALEGVFPSSG